MAENNDNMIKPVESLQNITRLTPAKRREERRRRRGPHAGTGQPSQEQPNDAPDETPLGESSLEQDTDHHSIDYCA